MSAAAGRNLYVGIRQDVPAGCCLPFQALPEFARILLRLPHHRAIQLQPVICVAQCCSDVFAGHVNDKRPGKVHQPATLLPIPTSYLSKKIYAASSQKSAGAWIRQNTEKSTNLDFPFRQADNSSLNNFNSDKKNLIPDQINSTPV